MSEIINLFGEPAIDPRNTRTALYIDDWTDEICPYTLQGWAEFLAGNAQEAPRAEPGQIFAATVVTYVYIRAVRDGMDWAIPEPPPGTQYHAVAFSHGGGWSPEDLVDSRADIEELLDTSADNDEFIVCRVEAEEQVRVRYIARPDGPACTIVGSGTPE